MSLPIETVEAPAPAPAPAHGWTSERKALFLDRLSMQGNARAACRAVGLSPEGAYKLRRRDALFARAWAAAVVLGRDASIEALSERAVEGVEEAIYYRGELVGTRRRYDSRLLLAHLARLDRLADEKAAGKDAGRFDELLACIAGEGEELPPTRSACIEQAAAAAADEERRQQMEDNPELFDETLGNLTADEAAAMEILDEVCDDVARRAAEQASQVWDRRLDEAFAAVDALREPAQPPILSGLPGAPLAPGDARAESSLAWNSEGAALSIPCTASTASTATIARCLAEPPPGWATAPRSPFTAPRKAGR